MISKSSSTLPHLGEHRKMRRGLGFQRARIEAKRPLATRHQSWPTSWCRRWQTASRHGRVRPVLRSDRKRCAPCRHRACGGTDSCRAARHGLFSWAGISLKRSSQGRNAPAGRNVPCNSKKSAITSDWQADFMSKSRHWIVGLAMRCCRTFFCGQAFLSGTKWPTANLVGLDRTHCDRPGGAQWIACISFRQCGFRAGRDKLWKTSIALARRWCFCGNGRQGGVGLSINAH